MKNKKGEIQKIKKVLRELKIRFRFDPKKTSGDCFPADEMIFIGIKEPFSKEWLYSVVFHEVAHVINYRNKKFYKYHNYSKHTKITKQFDQDSIRLMLRAERYTDVIGKQLLKKYFPKIKYESFYLTKEGEKYVKEQMVPWYQNQIKNNRY